MQQTQNHHHTSHNQHAHRVLQRSAAYLLAQACQTGPQRAKSLWLIPAQPHGAEHDRDVNAAKNIARFGLESLEVGAPA